MNKCPDCKKHLEENWDGSRYCPRCGQTEQDIKKRIAAGRIERLKVAAAKA